MRSTLSSKKIDLRGTPCPLNFIRCKLALERLENNELLQVDLDVGEPESMVIFGLRDAGHKVEILGYEDDWMRLLVVNNCGE